MSAGVVFQETLRILNRQQFPEASRRDLLAVLEAALPGPLAFLYDAGAEAGLPRHTLITRAVAIYIKYCVVNLCDDLSDGDCTYLSDPVRIGPCAQFLLQTLFFHLLAEMELPKSVVAAVTRDIVIGAGFQDVELRTSQWTASLYREVADGIAGRQWAAYLQILWCGTPLAERAATIGMNLGRAVLGWEDIGSHDPRYTTLTEADKGEVVAWATTAAHALRGENLRCLDAVLRTIDPVLEAHSSPLKESDTRGRVFHTAPTA
jgi:hypothetical protein